MAQLIINIGSAPSTGDGDPLRVAFDKINRNFADIYGNLTIGSGGTTVTGAVTSVAGKTGNVRLAVTDVAGSVTSEQVYNVVEQRVAAIIAAAPEELSTLEALSAALANDPNFANVVISSLSTKLDFVTGGTMTGTLTLAGDPLTNLNAATKQYVDNAFSESTIISPATSTTIGGVKIGNNLTVDAFGKIDAIGAVSSVSGMSGNVVLSTDDINGAASIAYVDAASSLLSDTKASVADLNALSSNVFTKSEIDSFITTLNNTDNTKANIATTYSKSEIDATVTSLNNVIALKASSALLANIALSGHFLDLIDSPALANVMDVPPTSKGFPGDAATDIAFDSDYFYYCVASYDGVTDIWRRVAHNGTTW